MSTVVELLRSRRIPQVAVLALISVGFAGCSADMSTRLSQNSYSSNPFAFDPPATGAVAAPPAERRELPQYRTGDGPIPLEGTDEEARADSILRVLAYLKRTLE